MRASAAIGWRLVSLACVMLSLSVVTDSSGWLATAQEGALSVETSDFPAELSVSTDPTSPIARSPFHVQASCAGLRTNATINASTSAPSWALIDVAPASWNVSPEECASGVVTLNATLEAAAHHGAVGGSRSLISASFVADSPGFVASTSFTLPIHVPFDGAFALALAQPSTAATVVPGGSTTIRVNLTNLGNADERITFDAVNGTSGIRVTLPFPLILRADPPGSATVNVTVLAGSVSGAQHADLSATSTMLVNASATGVTHAVPLEIDVASNPAPDLSLWVVLAVIVCVVALTRRHA